MVNMKHHSLVAFENEHGRPLKVGMRVRILPEQEEKKGFFGRVFGNFWDEISVVKRFEYKKETDQIMVILDDGLKVVGFNPNKIAPAMPLELEKKIEAQKALDNSPAP
ncbi:hypothetical protein D3C87_764690 [compost metagenome]